MKIRQGESYIRYREYMTQALRADSRSHARIKRDPDPVSPLS
jgi:hypothetical protein